MNKIESLAKFIDNIIFYLAVGLVFLFPLSFLTVTSEFTEYVKLVLLILASGLLVLLWVVKSLLTKKFVLSRTPFDLSFILIALSFILSTVFSINRNISIFGSFNSWHFIAVELLAFLGVMYAVVTNIKTWNRIKVLLISFMGASFVVALIALASYLGLFESLFSNSFLKQLTVNGFSPAGNIFSSVILWTVSAVLGVFVVRKELYRNKILMGLFVVNVLVVSLVLGLWLSPYIPGIADESRQSLVLNKLNFAHSWQIATSAIREYPIFGTGPSTYSIAFTAYRPAELNLNDGWSLTHTQAGNEYMTWLTTLGLVGFVVLLFFVFRILSSVRYVIFGEDRVSQSTADGQNLSYLRAPIAVSILGILIAYLFISSTVMTTGVLFMLLIFWMLIEKEAGHQYADGSLVVEESSLNMSNFKDRLSGEKINAGQFVNWLIAVPIMTIIIMIGFYTVQDLRSNLAFARSILALNNNEPANTIYKAQQDAINLNPRRDTYHRSYANTNISLARVIATQAGQEITDEQRSDILQLIQQAIREVRITTELLNPIGVLNWQVRGNVYQNLLGVANGADQWALNAYQNAIRLSPTDPRYYVNIGNLYFTLAVIARSEGETAINNNEPSEVIEEVPDTRAANLVRSEAAFLEAIRLKPDYTNAHYNLSVVYNEAARYDLAEQRLGVVLKLIGEDSPDYERVNSDLVKVQELRRQGQVETQPTISVTPTPIPTGN